MARQRWLLLGLVGFPLLLAACSSGGSGADSALGLGPTPTGGLPSVVATAPSTAAHPTVTAKPSRSATPTPTHSAAAAATHSAAPKPQPTTRPPTHKATPSPAKKASTLTIYVYDFYFSPANPTVPVGTKVIVSNTTSDMHTWTQGSGTHTPGGFDSGTLGANASYSYTFNKPGSYNFFCKYHYASYGMKGHITVT